VRSSAPVSRVTAASAAAVPMKPAFSPFAVDSSRKRFEGGQVESPGPVIARAGVETVTSVKVEVPNAVSEPPATVAKVPETREIVEPAAESMVATTESNQSGAKLQRVAIEALAGLKNQDTAAEALEDATWTVEAGEVRVQTGVSKAMLGVVVNPEAEKVVRAALRLAGAGALKLALLPGTATAVEKKPRVAKTGSVQAKAMEHPIVQQAQRLFQAEIRNVIDLREGD
jgi:DNA polymerase-3 subunit gamma/tau